MKKIICLCIALYTLISCDPPLITHEANWYIKNVSEDEIVFVTEYSKYTIEPQDSVCIATFYPFRSDGEPVFKTLWEDACSIDISASIESKDGKLLAKWYKYDQDNTNSFYNEKNWAKYRTTYSSTDEIKVEWVYSYKEPQQLPGK